MNRMERLEPLPEWVDHQADTQYTAAIRLLGERPEVEHYRDTLAEIRETGYPRYWTREFKPYLAGALREFSPKQVMATERLLKRRRGVY